MFGHDGEIFLHLGNPSPRHKRKSEDLTTKLSEIGRIKLEAILEVSNFYNAELFKFISINHVQFNL